MYIHTRADLCSTPGSAASKVFCVSVVSHELYSYSACREFMTHVHSYKSVCVLSHGLHSYNTGREFVTHVSCRELVTHGLHVGGLSAAMRESE